MFFSKVIFSVVVFSVVVLLLPCWARHADGFQIVDDLENAIDQSDALPAEHADNTSVLHEEDLEVLSEDSGEEEDVSADPLTMAYLEADEEQFIGDLDIFADRDLVAKVFGHKDQRQKRWVPLAVAGGRILFTAARAYLGTVARTRVTRSGARLTSHYAKPGNFRTAIRDFRSFNPSNVRRIQSRTASGYTGTVGTNSRMTVRNTSSSGRPTLEVRPNSGAGTVRKFRYGE